MSNVKIFAPVPFGLPTGAALTGAEWVPMDQTVGGVTTTIRSQASAIAALAVSSASILGTANQIAVSVAGGVATISFSANIAIPAPPSGIALSVTGIAGSNIPSLQVNGGSGAGLSNGVFIFAGAGSASDRVLDVINKAGAARNFGLFGDFSWNFANASNVATLSGSAAGNITIAAPSSGANLTLSAGNATNQNLLSASNTAGSFLLDVLASGNFEMGTVGATQLSFYTNNVTRLAISPAGNFAIGSPSSGDALTVNGFSGGNTAVFAQASGDALVSIQSTVSGNVNLNLNTGGAALWQIQNVRSTGNLLFNKGGLGTPLTISSVGNLIIAAPSSGNGLTINATTGQIGQLTLQGFTNAAGALEINLTRTSSANTIGNGPGFQFSDGTINNTNAIQSGAGILGIWGFGTGGWVENAQFSSAGGLVVGAPTGGNQGAGTGNFTGLFINGVAVSTGGGVTTGTFTATIVGITGATAPCTWTKVGNNVTMFMGVASSTAGTGTTFSINNLPAAIQPTTAKFTTCTPIGQNNGTTLVQLGAFVTGANLQFLATGSLTGWVSGSVRSVGNATGGACFTWDVT